MLCPNRCYRDFRNIIQQRYLNRFYFVFSDFSDACQISQGDYIPLELKNPAIKLTFILYRVQHNVSTIRSVLNNVEKYMIYDT